MIKQLYFSFLIYGFFLWFVMWNVWGLTKPTDSYAYITIGCGIVLSCVATILSLYKSQFSAVIGGISLLITVPMLIDISKAIGLSAGFFTPLLFISLLAFIVGIVNCILVLFKRKTNHSFNKKTKLVFVILPFALLTLFMAFKHFLN